MGEPSISTACPDSKRTIIILLKDAVLDLWRAYIVFIVQLVVNNYDELDASM